MYGSDGQDLKSVNLRHCKLKTWLPGGAFNRSRVVVPIKEIPRTQLRRSLLGVVLVLSYPLCQPEEVQECRGNNRFQHYYSVVSCVFMMGI